MADLFGGQDEQAFLERIRRRQKAQNGASPSEKYPLSRDGIDGEQNGESVGFEQKVRLFTEALEAVGGKVQRVATADAAYEVVVRELQRRGIGHAIAGSGNWPGGGLSALAEKLNEASLHLDRWDELSFEFGSAQRTTERVDRWGAGIDWADYGVAELGSIAIVASEKQSRSVSLLPPLHISLLPGERLLTLRRSVLAQAARQQKAGAPPLSLAFITGPSRSADIEMDLSIGVHGPGETIVVVVDPSTSNE